jgi:hypothetical protein
LWSKPIRGRKNLPDGFHGLEEEWKKVEAPLLEIDGTLEDFARSHGMEFARNYHAWPSRRLKWGEGVFRLIEISLEDEGEMTFNVWICAWRDSRRKRYWKNTYLKEGAPFTEIKDQLEQLLQEARETLQAWHKKDLRSSKKPPWTSP